LWLHNNTTNYANFFGVQYDTSIGLVFNKDVSIKKKYMAIGYQSNQRWCSPVIGDIETSMTNPQTLLQQVSQLIEKDIVLEENIRTANFKYDANSKKDPREGIVNGDFLGGTYIKVKLVYRGNEYSFVFLPYISYITSGRNF